MWEIPNNNEQYIQNSRWVTNVESMKNPGYHIGKISSQTLDAISDYWLKIQGSKDKNGEWTVDLNSDGKFDVIINGKKGGDWTIQLDKWIKELSFMYLSKGDWSNVPLTLISINHDGTTDSISFVKKQKVENNWANEMNKNTPEVTEFLTAKTIDAQLANWSIKPKDLVDNSFIQKSIIREWWNISDASILKIKQFTIILAKEAYPDKTLAGLSPQDIIINNRLPVMNMGLAKQWENGIVFDNKNPWFTVISKKDPSKELLRLTIDE